MKKINLKNFKISNDLPFVLIAGPCALESRDHCIMILEKLINICNNLKINLIFKTSFDKANRTNISSPRGLGLDESLKIFDEIKKNYDCPILTDIHNEKQCTEISDYVDIIQIPAFLSRQTDLLITASKTNKIINVKKGQFVSPYDVKHIIEKISHSGNDKIMLTERGFSFGYNNLVTDFRSIEIMKRTKYPVIFDATHSVQEPGSLGNQSGGKREFVNILSKAAIAIGVAGLFIETHEDPDNAPSDGPNMINISELNNILIKLIQFDNIAKNIN